jgi:putative hemolysin
VFVHEDMAAYKALEQFKKNGYGYALVADELGATSGLITISDILQALVGDVSDFHRDEYSLVRRDDGSWLVDGHYPLHDLLMRLERSQLVRDVQADTVAGLVLQQLAISRMQVRPFNGWEFRSRLRTWMVYA